MKTLKEFLHRIPRPYRVLVNLILILCLAAAFYVSIGSPALSQVHAFRRAERANLVGPSTILYSDTMKDYEYSHLIVAETDQGVITFATSDRYPYSFNYFKKTGDLTVVSPPKRSFLWGMDYIAVNLPVFVIHDQQDAHRAELELNIKGSLEYSFNGKMRTQTIDRCLHAQSDRSGAGYFRFSFQLAETGSTFLARNHGEDGFALDALAYSFVNRSGQPTDKITITAIVRLYAKDGTILLEQEQILPPNDRYWE